MKYFSTKMKTWTTIAVLFATTLCARAQFSGGSGTEQDPYLISTPAQLAQLATLVNAGNADYTNKHYKLANDIDLMDYQTGEGWIPIGNSATANQFQGVFEGAGKVIRNLTINRPSGDYQGLFGYTNGAIIRNLGVENCNITANGFTGGLVAYFNGGTVENCYTTGDVKGGNGHVGGMIGAIRGAISNIKHCYSECNVAGSGASSRVGGLLGRSEYPVIIENCYATGNVTGESWVGGLMSSLGYVATSANSRITNCYATGNVIGTSSAVGGLLGGIPNYVITVENCYATGNVQGTNAVGGIIGEVNGGSTPTIRNCVAANLNVSATAGTNANRIVGSGGTMQNCHALDVMVVKRNNAVVAITGGAMNNANGIAQNLTTLTAFNFYNTPANWYQNQAWSIASEEDNTKIWKIDDGASLPFFQWQNDAMRNPVIIAIAGSNGSIAPSGMISLESGGSQTFTITPNAYFVIDELLIDGVHTTIAATGGTYEFTNITANHTIQVTFKIDGFCGGNGTEETPYEICDAASLAHLATLVNAGNGNASIGKYFMLTEDIDLSDYASGDGWIPIGNNNTNNDNTRFRGVFDGAGKVIRNLTINRSASDNQGLFGYITDASIKNLGLENCNITARNFIGGLVGFTNGNTTIEKCYVSGEVKGDQCVGGMIGRCEGTLQINNCYTTCNVSGINYNIGGIIGDTQQLPARTMVNCYASGNISGTNNIGGLVGYGNVLTIRNCFAANASVTATNGTGVNRIAGNQYIVNFQNNYAFEGMTVISNGNLVNVTSGLNTIAGASKSFVDLFDFDFYNTAANWYNAQAWSIAVEDDDTKIWNIFDGASFPFLQWQKDVERNHAIIATAGSNGTIAPSGIISLESGGSQTFTITPNAYFVVDALWIDGVHTAIANAGGTYEFTNVTANHTIHVTFKFDGFCGGNGAEESPYEICDAATLAHFSTVVNAGNGNTTLGNYFMLTDDIDLSGYAEGEGWIPIGNSVAANRFQGNFDGNGKVVRNLTINRASSEYQGLFGVVSGATITNLGIEDCNINANQFVGGLAGQMNGSTINNCYVTGVLNGTGGTCVGGMIGELNGAANNILKCYTNCTITGSSSRVGGLLGRIYFPAIVENCYATGTVTGSQYVGGLLGNFGQNSNVVGSRMRNCYATGNVTGTSSSVGGLVGHNSNYAITFENCYAVGNVTGTTLVGGVVGGSDGNTVIFRNCVAANLNVSATNGTDVNRISGSNNTLQNNYAFEGMVVRSNGNPVTIATGLNSAAGASKSFADLTDFDFYGTASNWHNAQAWSIAAEEDNTKIWNIFDGASFPFLQWQKDVERRQIIVATADSNGAIAPSGIISLESGGSQTFTITPNEFFVVDALLINGVNTSITLSDGKYEYEFINVTANQTIQITFKFDGFCGGNGAEESPYKICDAATLAHLATVLNSGNSNATAGRYFILTDDIDLSVYAEGEGWTSIGNNAAANQFRGIFDGAGKVIRNLTINRTEIAGDYQGLFGYISDATIKNIYIEECNISANEWVGGLTGACAGSNIENCHVSGNVNGFQVMGGLIGELFSPINNIRNCFSSCNVTGTGSGTDSRTRIGGLLGRIGFRSNIENCYATGDVSGDQFIGGLLGNVGEYANVANTLISNCYATGNVTGTSNEVGGLIGRTPAYTVTIVNCYSCGNVTGSNNVGGLVGFNNSNLTIIRNCVTANANITATNGTIVNRIAGSGGIFQNNYANADMKVLANGNSATITPNLNTAAGASKSFVDFLDFDFYNTAANWYNNQAWNIAADDDDTKIWNIFDGASLPFFQWQKDIASNPVIIATADINGAIEPSGIISLESGGSQTFTITPNEYFVVDSLWVNGEHTAIAATGGAYEFTNVTANHTIQVTFKLNGFCGGNGAEESPYEICDAATLAHLATLVNAGNGNATLGKYFILTDDIDLSDYAEGEDWTPIGYYISASNYQFFQGNFNGKGKVVKNLTINRPANVAVNNYQGLFGPAQNATIKNVGIENCNINGYQFVGGLVGNINGSIIDNCYVTGIVKGNRYVGGLTGQFCINTCNVRNCYTTCDVIGTASEIGGIVGISEITSTIENCYTTGNITGTNNVGGLLGQRSGGGTVTVRNCVAANASVAATNGTNVNRIAGGMATLQNNYANEDMIVTANGNLVTITSGLNTAAGEGKPLETLRDFDFYQTASNWYNAQSWSIASEEDDTKIWRIYDGLTFPFFQWRRQMSFLEQITCSGATTQAVDFRELFLGGDVTWTLSKLPDYTTGYLTSGVNALPEMVLTNASGATDTLVYTVTSNVGDALIYAIIVHSVGDFSENITPARDAVMQNIPVTFAWEAVAGASFYDIYIWSADASCPETPAKANQQTLQYVHSADLEYGYDYHWKIVAKSSCAITESETFSFTVRSLPNLHVTEVTATEIDPAARQLNVSWQVRNDGNGDVIENGWKDRIWLVSSMQHGTLSATTHLLTTVDNISRLASGDHYSNSAQITLPGRFYGTYYLIVAADMTSVYSTDWSPSGDIIPVPYQPDISGTPYPYLFAAGFNGKTVVESKEHATRSDNFFYLQVEVPEPPKNMFLNANLESITFGNVAIDLQNSTMLQVSAQDLDEPLAIAITGDDSPNFAISYPANWNAVSGGNLNVGFAPDEMRSYQAVLIISAGGLQKTIPLSGTGAYPSVVNVSASVENQVYTSSDRIPISGQALYSNNMIAANISIEICIEVLGYRRTITAQTDENGQYEVIFTPQAGESGNYRISAYKYGSVNHTLKAVFDIPGMSLTSNNWILWEVEKDIPKSGTIFITNRSAIPLNNLRIETVSSPSNAVFAFSGVQILEGLQTVALDYTVIGTELTTASSWQEIKLSASSDEEISFNFSAYFFCKRSRGVLDVTPHEIKTTMTKGASKIVEIELLNNGNGPTGTIRVSIPQVEWLQLASSDTISSINPQESAKISLRLAPHETTPLNVPLTGGIAINCENGNNVMIPFSVQAVSENTGNLVIDVVNEYYYNTEAAPHLANARVKVTHPYSFEVIAEGYTDESGLFAATIPEGLYTIFVEAEKHDKYRNNILIEAGETAFRQIFLSFQAITYTWVVVPTEIQDEYLVELIVKFETNVPVPVITIDSPHELPELNDGEEHLFNLVLTNHGLIAANDVVIFYPDIPDYAFTPLIGSIGSLDAQTSLMIPVLMTLKNENEIRDDNSERTSGRSGASCSSGGRSCSVKFAGTYSHPCGDQDKFGQFVSRIANFFGGQEGNRCGLPEIMCTIIQDPPHQIPPPPGGCIDCGSGSDWSWGWEGRRSIGDGIEIDLGCDGCKVPPCVCKYGPKIPGIKKIAGPVCKIIKAGECIEDALQEYEKTPATIFSVLNFGQSMWGCAKPFLSGGGEKEKKDNVVNDILDIIDVVKMVKDKIDEINDILDCIKSVYDYIQCKRGKGDGEKTSSFDQYISASFTDDLDSLVMFLFYRELVVIEYLGTDAFFDSEDYDLFFDAVVPFFSDGIAFDIANRNAILEQFQNSDIQADDIENMFDRWNNTLGAWNAGVFIPNSTYPDIVSRAYLDYVFQRIVDISDYAKARGFDGLYAMSQNIDNEIEAIMYKPPRTSVCASVTLQIDQRVTMTREAFRGTLTINNGHEDTSMTDIGLNLIITDELGNNSNHLFHIETESLQTLTGVDGAGALFPQSQGSATILFIPTVNAAPTEVKIYSFGGTFSYTDPFSGETVTVTLFPVALEVHPSPYLTLHYFMQRNIFGDDPLTEDVVEPIIPGELALMIDNKGYGVARNVTVESAQPIIIDNEKGLLIDFKIIGSNLNGQERQLGVTEINFGDIAPRSQMIGQWWITSSLLGHFVKYEARLKHLDSRGNPDLSLIENVYIHELTRSIYAYGILDDGIPDFLVNDIFDAHDNPDAIYFSNGTKTNVMLAESASTDRSPTEDNLVVNLAVNPLRAGWNYARIDDPGNGNYNLISVTREDGQAIPISNVWLTHCTLPDGGDPIYENKLHYVDTLSTAGMMNYTLVFERKNVPVQVDRISGIPVGSIYEPLQQVTVHFSKPIQESTFTWEDMELRVQGGDNLMDESIIITKINDMTYNVNFGNQTRFFGYYVFTVHTTGIKDLEGNPGELGRQATWIQIIHVPDEEIEATICEGDSYELNGVFYTATGVYLETITDEFAGNRLVRLVLTVIPLEAPVALPADYIGENSFSAFWHPATCASEYELSVYSYSQGTTIAHIDGSPFTVLGTNYNVMGLNAASTYYYVVKAKNRDILSEPSNEIEIITKDEAIPITVTSVTVSPNAATIEKGSAKTFSATVAGTGNPAQTVAWRVEGGVSGTTITPAGVLTVAANETAAMLTVRATSTVDDAKSGTATVTVISALPHGSGEIKGTVDNAPAGTTVYLYVLQSSLKAGAPAGYVLVAVTQTDANGNYSFDGLPEGVYVVVVVIDGFESTPSAPATVSDGKTVGNINFTVEGNTIIPSPVSITGSEELFASDLKVYPNPFTGEVRIIGAVAGAVETQDFASLRVINAAGVVVHIQLITNFDETIRLKHLPAGIYFFQLEKEGQTKTLKVVKN